MHINSFISKYITLRQESLFAIDIENNFSELSAAIKGKSVMVIGGAGTIGSSYIRALLPFEPAKLVVVDTNENGLTELTRDLRSQDIFMPESYLTYPMDFGMPVFEKMLAAEGPFEIVANFAAHKHVRSEKDRFSIEAMLENNVLKAERLLDILSKNPPERFFCVSTDKAANPVNVMGASKKLMEELIMSYTSKMHITTARFANVAFSNGSLLDGYLLRMQKQQPLSCPANVQRYFVSPEESGQICLLACMLGHNGTIFFPKLKTEQLAFFKDITLAFLADLGHQPYLASSEADAKSFFDQDSNPKQYPVFFFDSETSGEKLYEEFYQENDSIDWGSFQSLGVISNAKQMDLIRMQQTLQQLRILLEEEALDKAAIVKLMQQILPDFKHIETGKNLDQKM